MKILVDFGGENLVLDLIKFFEFELGLEEEFFKAFLKMPYDFILFLTLMLDLETGEIVFFTFGLFLTLMLLALLLDALNFLFGGLSDFLDIVSLAFG